MAVILAGEGTHVIAVARNQAELERLAADLSNTAGSIEPMPADLADPIALADVVDRLTQSEQPIDLLVNNAGLGFVGDFVDIPDEQATVQIDVNVVALQTLAAAAARTMVTRPTEQDGGGLEPGRPRVRRRGTILNVSSLAGDVPGPRSATYNATKAFVTSLSESLTIELAPHDIVVTCLCPGLTRTDFQPRAGYDADDIPDALWQSAEVVAALGLDAAAAGKAVVVSGWINKTASRLARLAPRGLTRWSTDALNRK